MSFDLHYYPLVYRAGREGDAIPGLQVLAAPLGSNRHRQRDLLALMLTLSGDHRYDPEEIQALTLQAGQAFFQVSGSVTRAMQAVADFLNKQIFDRNLDRGYEGVRALGALNLAALHNDWLFIGQVGRTQAIFINSEMVQAIDEPADAGDFLGLSRRVQMRLSQTEAQPGDLLLLCEQPPASWTVQNLAGSASLAMPQVKRRLMNQVTGSLETVAVKFQPGRGKVLAGKWTEIETPLQPEQPRAPVNEPTRETISPQPETAADTGIESMPYWQDHAAASRDIPESRSELDDEPESDISIEDDGGTGKDEPETYLPAADRAGLSEPSQASFEEDQIPVIEGQVEESAGAGIDQGGVKPLSAGPGSFTMSMAKTWMKLKAAHEKLSGFFGRIDRRFKAAQPPLPAGSPPLMMVVLAIAIPLVVILAAITVYAQSGTSEEHQALLVEAQQAAALASDTKDAARQRAYWAQALDLVTRAQEYTTTQESRALFEKAQTSLDALDLAGRLNFRPALTEFFPQGVVITHIQSASSGVYLLDQTSGSILRISLNSKGFYELDQEFQCVPGPYGLTTVTKLVDFEVLPANTDNYRVVGVDAQGNLLYCRPGELPLSRPLTPPTGGWKRINDLGYDSDILYVLDADADAVWMYEGKNPEDQEAAGVIFSEKPIKFFDEDVPDLGGAIDLAVNEEDLYILHQDGHMSLCRYSALKEVKLTECQDPAPYSDNRAGREKHPWIFMDSNFEMMQRTVVPNAAIYILDGANRSINQFSNQLNLEYVFKPQVNPNYPMPNTVPTGFGISSDMEVFLAYDNQLFIAPLK
jgi:hypothetical protein